MRRKYHLCYISSVTSYGLKFEIDYFLVRQASSGTFLHKKVTHCRDLMDILIFVLGVSALTLRSA